MCLRLERCINVNAGYSYPSAVFHATRGYLSSLRLVGFPPVNYFSARSNSVWGQCTIVYGGDPRTTLQQQLNGPHNIVLLYSFKDAFTVSAGAKNQYQHK